jgi:hypothetical protein
MAGGVKNGKNSLRKQQIDARSNTIRVMRKNNERREKNHTQNT